MSTLSDIAAEHQRRRTVTTDKATVRALRQFRQIDPAFLDAGWDRVSSAMVDTVSAAQVAAARQAGPYLDRVAAASGGAPERAQLVSEAFGGVMLDGREVGPAMFSAVTTTKTLVGRGMPAARAFEVGASFLAVIVGAAVQDLGRQADETIATGRGYTRYIRVVSAGACSRCAILAGGAEYRAPFERHPRCKCTSLAVTDGEGTPAGFYETPSAYFDSLSPAEQDRIFTRGGAEAIRSGADPIRVVNARRGADGISTSRGIGRNTTANSGRRIHRQQIGVKPDGTPVMGVTTSDGTYRGGFRSTQNQIGVGSHRIDGNRYSATKRTRLMPETIMELADDLPTRQLLLRDAGYLEFPVGDTSTNAWVAKRLESQIADRAAADAFYRKLGVSLG